jgi:CRISPR type III-B/RAMP module RAMP protein Cmr6
MYPHPQSVIDFLGSVGARRENLGLVMEKFIDWFEDKRGNYTPNRRDYFTQLINILKKAPPPDFMEVVQALAARRQAVYSRSPFPVRSFTAETLWYYTSGKGASDLVGNLMFFHNNFAVPIIRGSSIRGSAQVYARDYLLPEGQITEEEIKFLFGSSPEEEELSKGALIFFDAFPLTANCLKMGVITNQNDGYYSGNEQSMARNNVIPIFHLSAPSGVPFLFAIGAVDAPTLERGENILRQSLRKCGTGAKIRVGYGYFKSLEEQPTPSP